MGVKIKNLPDFSGMPENGDYFAVTNGEVTSKLNYNLLAQAIVEQYSASLLGGTQQTIQDAVSSLFGAQWKYLGTAGSAGADFVLPTLVNSLDTYLILTAHNSTSWLNTLWVIRPGNNAAYKLTEGANQCSSSDFVYRSGFAPYSSGNGAVRRNNVVSLRLIIKNTSPITFGNTNIMVATLPVGFRPQIAQSYLQQGSLKNFFRAEVFPDGGVGIQRYGITENVETPANGWLNLDCTYVAADPAGVTVTVTDNVNMNVITAGGNVNVFMARLPEVIIE